MASVHDPMHLEDANVGFQYLTNVDLRPGEAAMDLIVSELDVTDAERVFHAAEEELRQTTKQLAKTEYSDTEKLAAPKDAGFNLQDFLEDSVRVQETYGIKKKRMGVVFKHLSVIGEGADASSIATVMTPLAALVSKLNPINWFRKIQRGTDFHILHDLSGCVKDGEMLLVLGRPGAGCSTFLRVVANQRETYKAITGDVSYGGIPANEFDRYTGEAIYTAEEDTHFPTLTVRQTLSFALKTKTPGNVKRVPEATRKIFQEKVMYMLLNMFGLTKQIDTLVGNEFVRGLSGGERKRMTVAEAMTARSAINCWDCSTRGLDAASALDYTKSLRIMSNTLHKTTICSFYQASEDMYSLFDKVMVLDKGRCIFLGPTKRAKAYFEEMGFECEPRKSTPDFLTGITNANERKIRPGYENKIPRNPAEMEGYFRRSPDWQKMLDELEAYEKLIEREQPSKEFLQAVRESKARRTSANSAYTSSFFQQVRALTVREFQLIWGDKGALIGKVFSVISKGFIYATVFINMPLDSNGAFMRGGALFSSVLFNSLISLSELPNAMRGRRILQKHKSYAMFHPSALHIAQVVSDIPTVLIQVFAFSLCAYFIFGLVLDAEHFFIYMFTLFLVACCLTDVFRLCGNLSKSYFGASQAANGVLILLLTYTGFIVPYKKMKPWFVWIYWINPMAYAFKGILSNEMRGLRFPCEGTGAIPFGPIALYEDPTYQACVLKGQNGTGADLHVSGDAYLMDAYGYDTSQMSVNIFAVFLWWIFYIILNCLAMEYIDMTSGGYTRQVYKKGKAPKQNVVDITSPAEVAAEKKGGALQEFETNTMFTWQNVNYTVPVKGGTRQLLNSVQGWIKPGQMTALMGSSGAGKTTLLDVLARRKTLGTIEGNIYLNGKALGVDYERITGYVEQMDIHNPAQTVREALRFSAMMRQDMSVPLEEKYAYVESVLEMMEMTHLGDALIGDLDLGIGISVEERKRLTIGMELVGKPKILFLDEPTSGLDAQSSYNIIKFIRRLADHGMPLVCTIHQPSPVLFEYFDRLLLLARGGKTVYFGDIGPHSQTLLGYFERNGARKCGADENPAEYILQAIGAGVASKAQQDWPEIWSQSGECKKVAEELDRIQKGVGAQAPDPHAREFSTPLSYQLYQVYKRMNVAWWRDPTYNIGRVLNALFVGLLNGFSFYKLGNSSSDMQSRVFTIFQILIMGNSLIILAQPQLMKQRQYFRREYASKFYGWIPFAVSIVMTELPYLVLTAAICVCTSYWTVGLETTAERGFYFWIMFVLFMFFSVSFGQAVAAACQTLVQAAVMNPFFTSFLILFAGVLNPPHSLVKFWRSWMYPLNPYHYFLEGVITDVLYGVKVECVEEDFLTFLPRPSMTCGAYMTPWFQGGGPGYVANPNATAPEMCKYCPYKAGEEFYNLLEWDFAHRWRNFGIVASYWIFNIILCVGLTYAFRKPRR